MCLDSFIPFPLLRLVITLAGERGVAPFCSQQMDANDILPADWFVLSSNGGVVLPFTA